MNGIEITFESLEQIAELVRRGFLSAGLGPGGSAAPTPGGRPPPEGGGKQREAPLDRPQSRAAEHYERMIKRTETEERAWHNDSKPAREDLERIATAAESLWRTGSQDSELIRPLLTLMTTYAESITIDWERRVAQQPDPFDLKMLVDWYGALCAIGVWMDGGRLHDFVNEHDCNVGRRMWENFWVQSWPVTRANESAALPRQHLLSYAPCPRRPNWVPGLRRLSDKITLPMCIGTYFDDNRHLPELAPSVLGAILLTSGGFPSAVVTRGLAENRLATAIRWLVREVPALPLPRDAEGLINDYAWGRVDGRPAGAPPAN